MIIKYSFTNILDILSKMSRKQKIESWSLLERLMLRYPDQYNTWFPSFFLSGSGSCGVLQNIWMQPTMWEDDWQDMDTHVFSID